MTPVSQAKDAMAPLPEHDRPTVSVVMPTYNAAKFVARAVASARAQTDVGAVEIIAVDDASRDGTVAELRRLAEGASDLRILENAVNGGPSARRNQGVAAARGHWIAVLDADDAYAPGRLARLVAAAEAGGFDVIADLPLFWDLTAGCAEPEQAEADGSTGAIALRDLVDPAATLGLDLGLLKPMFRRRLADGGLWHYPENVRHGEDFELYFSLLSRGVPFGLLREAHYIFSTRVGAVSKSRSEGSVTRLDFLGLARQAEARAAELDTRPDPGPELAAMMRLRASNARRSNRVHGWSTLRRREIGAFLTWLRHDPENPGEITRILWSKLRGHRGWPD